MTGNVAIQIALRIGSRGLRAEEELLEGLRDLHYVLDDLGAFANEPCDYPDVAHAAATGIAQGTYERGILVCGTGVGMAMVANRYRGVRAANCGDVFSARYARAHNDANVLTLGGRVLGVGLAWDIVNVWLATPFGGGERHVRRVAKIDAP